MASISFGGLGNGVDFSQVITQLVAVEHLPIDALTQKKSTLQSKLTEYGSATDKLLALQAAGDRLRLPTAFDQTSTTVSDQTALTASSASTASPGTYLIQVTQLAQSHQIANKGATAVASPTTSIVSGASATFTFHVGSGTNQTVTLGAAATIDELKTGINDLGAGVTASIVNTGSDTTPAYRLILTATASGASNGVTIVADGTTLDFLNGGGTGGVDTLQAVQDAIVTLGDPTQNPVTLHRSSNVITDAIPDVTLSLTKNTTSAVSVNVTRDNGAVKANIQNFVKAYNDIVTFVNKDTAYDVTTKTGAILNNETSVKGFMSRIQQALSAPIGGLTTYGSVGEIGFQTNRDGTITLDNTQLDSALSTNYNAVKSLFIHQTTVAGVAERVNQAIAAIDDVVSGSLTVRKNTLISQINSLTDQISRKETAISAFEERLKLQYARLDTLLSNLQGQTNFLTTLGKQPTS